MKYTFLKNKYTIKIPENITVIYCNDKNVLIFVGPKKKKTFKPKVKIILSNHSNLIIVTNISSNKKLFNKKKFKIIQGTTFSLIKQIIIEINYKLYCKLKLVGVGYRSIPLLKMDNQLSLKLGYSHIIYFRIPESITIKTVKFTNLYLFGEVPINEITLLKAMIRNCRLPEPYKGKGVLYNEEDIKLKKGKKI